MKQPPGFVLKGQEDLVFRLIKPLYGLKQAGNAWNNRINDILIEIGYRRLIADPCLYVLREASLLGILSLYVDDMYNTGTPPRALEYTFEELSKRIEITDLGPVKHLLGVAISRNRTTRTVTFSQERYARFYSDFIWKTAVPCALQWLFPRCSLKNSALTLMTTQR